MKMGFAHILSFLNHFIQFFIYSFKCKNAIFFLTLLFKEISYTFKTYLQGTQRTKKKKKILSKIADGEIFRLFGSFSSSLYQFFVDCEKVKV